MSPSSINIAIAKTRGLNVGAPYSDGARWCDASHQFIGSWLTERSPERWHGRLPDYHSSLDAIHEAILALPAYQFNAYAVSLIALCEGQLAALKATAPQCAESYLRCLGLWEETP